MCYSDRRISRRKTLGLDLNRSQEPFNEPNNILPNINDYFTQWDSVYNAIMKGL
jgi:hypothetical protein